MPFLNKQTQFLVHCCLFCRPIQHLSSLWINAGCIFCKDKHMQRKSLSRVRCDQGGGNNAVCLFVEVFRGSGRGSASRWRSTHNQRIERLWGDVWRGVVNVYHSLFTLLENDGVIDCNNEMHVRALHYIYLSQINRDLQLFVNQWNHHCLRTARYMSPYQFFVRGCPQLQAQNSTGIQRVFGADEQPAQPAYLQYQLLTGQTGWRSVWLNMPWTLTTWQNFSNALIPWEDQETPLEWTFCKRSLVSLTIQYPLYPTFNHTIITGLTLSFLFCFSIMYSWCSIN